MTTLEPSEIQLSFVPLEQLLPHEEDDPNRVMRLVQAFSSDGKLRNPPIVAICESKFVVLDGATRVSALRSMGFRDTLVQVVDYNQKTVTLKVWHHVIEGLSPNQLLANLADVDGLTIQPVDAIQACELLAARQIEACIIMRNGMQFAVLCEGDICDQTDLLCQLVAVYRGKAEVHRTTHVNLPILVRQYPHLSAVVVFPVYQPFEIIQIATSGSKVPMGVTRHIISGRALGLNIPLEKLGNSLSLEEKNTWLNDLVRQRICANKIRLYQEPVFVFDE